MEALSKKALSVVVKFRLDWHIPEKEKIDRECQYWLQLEANPPTLPGHVPMPAMSFNLAIRSCENTSSSVGNAPLQTSLLSLWSGGKKRGQVETINNLYACNELEIQRLAIASLDGIPVGVSYISEHHECVQLIRNRFYNLHIFFKNPFETRQYFVDNSLEFTGSITYAYLRRGATVWKHIELPDLKVHIESHHWVEGVFKVCRNRQREVGKGEKKQEPRTPSHTSRSAQRSAGKEDHKHPPAATAATATAAAAAHAANPSGLPGGRSNLYLDPVQEGTPQEENGSARTPLTVTSYTTTTMTTDVHAAMTARTIATTVTVQGANAPTVLIFTGPSSSGGTSSRVEVTTARSDSAAAAPAPFVPAAAVPPAAAMAAAPPPPPVRMAAPPPRAAARTAAVAPADVSPARVGLTQRSAPWCCGCC